MPVQWQRVSSASPARSREEPPATDRTTDLQPICHPTPHCEFAHPKVDPCRHHASGCDCAGPTTESNPIRPDYRARRRRVCRPPRDRHPRRLFHLRPEILRWLRCHPTALLHRLPMRRRDRCPPDPREHPRFRHRCRHSGAGFHRDRRHHLQRLLLDLAHHLDLKSLADAAVCRALRSIPLCQFRTHHR